MVVGSDMAAIPLEFYVQTSFPRTRESSFLQKIHAEKEKLDPRVRGVTQMRVLTSG